MGVFFMAEKEKPLSNDGLAAEFDKGSGVAFLPKRIERYSNAKARQIKILTHLTDYVDPACKIERINHVNDSNDALIKTALRIAECGNYLVFNHYYTVDDVRLSKASFCMKHLLCPLCAIRRGAKQVRAYLEKFELLRNENPRLKPHLLTLTVKNGHDLSERFEHLTRSVKKLLERRRDALKGKTKSELTKALGGVFSYEFTRSKHGWHPHVHMVILCDQDNPILAKSKDSKLSKEWLAITGDSFIVDVTPFYGDPSEGFIEVFKYALKFSDLSPQENLTAYLTLKARRLTGSFGLFWGVQVPESMTDQLLDELPYIELFYKYTRAGYSLAGTREGAPVGEGSPFSDSDKSHKPSGAKP
jgi:hypothetical protein